MVGNEAGVLTHVTEAPVRDKCFLYMSHNDHTYVGCLLFEDAADCRSVADLLRRNIGKPIQEIGELEVAEKRLG